MWTLRNARSPFLSQNGVVLAWVLLSLLFLSFFLFSLVSLLSFSGFSPNAKKSLSLPSNLPFISPILNFDLFPKNQTKSHPLISHHPPHLTSPFPSSPSCKIMLETVGSRFMGSTSQINKILHLMQSKSATEETSPLWRGDRLFAETTGSLHGPNGLEFGLWWAFGLELDFRSDFRILGLD